MYIYNKKHSNAKTSETTHEQKKHVKHTHVNNMKQNIKQHTT